MTEICLYAYSKENQIISFHVEAEPFTRKTIYGSRKIIALDKEGNECKTAQLSSNGTEVFPKGGTGTVKLLQSGTIYDDKDADEKSLIEKQEHQFVLGKQNYRMKKVEKESQMNDFYETEIERLYVLKGINSINLMQFMNDGLFEVHLNAFRKGYVFSRNRNVFLETGKDEWECENHFDFVKKDNLDFLSDQDITLDDIDFGMLE